MDLSTSYTIKAQVQGQNQIGGLEKGLGKLKNTTNTTTTAMNKLKGAASNAFGALKALAPAIGVAGLGKLVNDTLELGDMLQKLSVTSGVSVEMLDKLRISSQLAGTDFKALQRAFPVLAKNMQDASDGVGTAKEAFERIGFSATDSSGKLKSMDQAILEISDLMRKTKDDTLNLANANEIFGGGVGRKLVPLLKEGSEAIMSLNSGFSQENAEKMAAFNDKVTLLGEKFNVLKIQLTEAVLPTLTKLVEIIGKGAEIFAALPTPVKVIATAFALLAPAILVIAPTIAALIVSFKIIMKVKLAVVIGKIATSFGLVITAVKGAILAFAPLLAGAAIPAAIIGLGVLIFKFRDEIGSALKAVGQFFVDTFMIIPNFIGGVINKGIEMAKNAFNRLPNIVQQAIKAALTPFNLLIKTLKGALNLIARVRGARKQEQAEGSAAVASVSNTTAATSTAATSASSSVPALPYTYGYAEAGQDMSFGNIGDYRGFTSSAGISEFPSNGSSFTNRPKSKSPNINIKTGNVVQFNNENYVTTQDLQSAVQSGVSQTLNYIQADGITHYL